MKLKFETLNKAKTGLIDAITIQYKATLEGDFRTADKYSKKIILITNYIKTNYGLEQIKDLLDNDNDKVRVWASKSLLPIYADIAIKVLEEIGSKDVPHCSFNARIILSEWTGKPLKF
jgi:hypothetical protein